jgi:hypothetical protein
MMKARNAALALALGGSFLTAPAGAEDFRWHGALSDGKTLEVKGVNGNIDAALASGDEAEVVAVKRAKRSNPDSVEIRVVEHADGVTICAIYPSRAAHRTRDCDTAHGGMNADDNDVEVRFTVRVPQGVTFRGRTVNGGIQAEGLAAPVDVETVNGDVRLGAEGSARAQTVNGSIRASLARAAGSDPLEFETVNGSIELALPADLDADLRAETVNGDIQSDFPLDSRSSRRDGPPTSARGRLGSGGRSLKLETVNGSIEVRKS